MSDVALSCAHCQSPLPAGAKFCKACGTPVASAVPAAVSTCPDCHADLPVGARFCKSCGADLRPPSAAHAAPVSPPVVQPVQPEPVAPAPVAPQIVPPVQPVSSEQPAIQPDIQPTIQPVVLETAPKAAGRNKNLRIGLAALLLIIVIGVGLGVYLVLNMNKKIETPAVPVEISTDVAPLPGSETPPEATEAGEQPAPEAMPASDAAVPEQPASATTTPAAKPVKPKETASKPVESAPKPEPAATPAPQRPKSCKQAVGGGVLLCNIEGASRFWRCAPDGENWNTNLSGCERNTGRDNSRPY